MEIVGSLRVARDPPALGGNGRGVFNFAEADASGQISASPSEDSVLGIEGDPPHFQRGNAQQAKQSVWLILAAIRQDESVSCAPRHGAQVSVGEFYLLDPDFSTHVGPGLDAYAPDCVRTIARSAFEELQITSRLLKN